MLPRSNRLAQSLSSQPVGTKFSDHGVLSLCSIHISARQASPKYPEQDQNVPEFVVHKSGSSSGYRTDIIDISQMPLREGKYPIFCNEVTVAGEIGYTITGY
jgi:hypothetical protein